MKVEIVWYDNAAFRMVTAKETFWFDPSVNKNADSPIRVEDIREPANLVFTTPGDPGHFANSVEVAQKTGAQFVGNQELCDFILQKGQLSKDRVIPLQFGETRKIGDLDVYLFEAEHPELSTPVSEMIAQWGVVHTRNGGLVVRKKEFTLCILGDCIHTDVFREVGQKFPIDIGMIPIQGKKHAASAPEDAAENGARIVRDLKVKFLFPVIQYSKEKVRIDPLRRRLKEIGLDTRLIFDRPGTVHTLTEFQR